MSLGFDERVAGPNGYSTPIARIEPSPFSPGPFSALLITGSMLLQPAPAQSVPPGSYRASCTDIRVEDRTLAAVCRIADGREQTTSLTDVNRCVGDIGNGNGAPTCGHGQPMAPYRQDRR
jgi:hypothetical protein